MFSACASSQISSVDSYTTGLATDEGWAHASNGMDDLIAELGDNISEESDVSSDDGSHSSILNALSFSSDSELDYQGETQHIPSKSSALPPASETEKGCQPTPQPLGKAPPVVKKPKIKGRSRSPMGSYIPSKGGKPLSKCFFTSPGPAAYNPNANVVKPRAPEYLLKFRTATDNAKNQVPGPGAYDITIPCCPDTYKAAHMSKRFHNPETVGPGPAPPLVNENAVDRIGKDKPKALIVSRPKLPFKQIQDQAFSKPLYGWTRFGLYSIPGCVIIGRPLEFSPPSPGPGAYDPEKCLLWCRPGISMTPRRVPKNPGSDTPGPYYPSEDTPQSLNGPAFSIQSRHGVKVTSDSPGPIYDIPPDPKKPVTMVFKPFPMRGKTEDPGPSHYENAGDQGIKVKPKAPNPLIVSQNYPPDKRTLFPGPNQYSPASRICFSCYNQVSLKGRRKEKKGTPSPGPGHYDIPSRLPHMRKPPVAVIPRGISKKSLVGAGESSDCAGYYNPKLDKGSVRNIFLSGRHKPLKPATLDVPFYDLTGFTMKGKRKPMPISFKSRQSPFVYQGVPSSAKSKLDTCNLKSLKYEKPAGGRRIC